MLASGSACGAASGLGTGGVSCELHNVVGDAGGVVAGDAGLFQIVAENRDYAQSFDGIEVGDDLAGAFLRILCLQFQGNGRAIDQGVVEYLLVGVVIESSNVVGSGEAEALISLRHQVADVNLDSGRVDDGFSNAVHQQIRDEAGE